MTNNIHEFCKWSSIANINRVNILHAEAFTGSAYVAADKRTRNMSQVK